MYRNKYGFFKRTMFRFFELVPPAGRLKSLAASFRVSSFRKRLDSRRAAVEAHRREHGHSPLFDHVEIETINRCNGGCNFCPVNRHLDPRPFHLMPDELFHSIIGQLADLEYAGEVCLFSNNESLMDKRIESFVARARRELPKARLLLSTNGTLLTPDRYRALIDNLDLLYVNNYCTDFKLRPENGAILELSRSRPDWWEKTHVVVRYERDLMSSRGGQAPNRKGARRGFSVGCTLPTSQLILRPDGKVSLCCNDAIGVMTLGDASQQSLTDIWWGTAFENVRARLLNARSDVELCRFCDTLGD